MSLGKAKANPTKAFFVRMITKDISLEDCILDLIDNSVDGAWQQEGGPPMNFVDGPDLSKYQVAISASQDQFSIQDNCGGISFDDAVQYAFTFGREDDLEDQNYSIGVYGIGMKRAVFKMGTAISVRSTYKGKDKVDSFDVPINVSNWLAEVGKSWDFDIEEAEPLAEPGVVITVTNLNEETQLSFGNPAFIENLKRTIGRDYSTHLHRGLRILVNGEMIRGWQIELLQGGEFDPLRVEYDDEVAEGKVTVEILAGMAAPPPESSEPSDLDRSESRFGWYVVCNGRIVLAADKGTLSGWGTDDWPQWHPQYAGFIGLIFFTSKSAKLLPLTTTKRNVDVSSGVFRRARPRMREVTKEWIAYTNVRKQTLEEAKRFEAVAKPIAIYEVQKRVALRLPTLTAKPKERMASINYSIPFARVRKLANELGNINMSNRDVGIRSFEYTYADKVSED